MTTEAIAARLAAALRMMPCACQYGPEWRNVATSIVPMEPVKSCLKHAALKEYDEFIKEVNHD